MGVKSLSALINPFLPPEIDTICPLTERDYFHSKYCIYQTKVVVVIFGTCPLNSIVTREN